MKGNMEDQTIDGVTANYGAKRMHSMTPPNVSVWDADGVVLFILPVDSTVEHVNAAIAIHEKSYRDGKHFGAWEVRNKVRETLGLSF